MLNLLMVKKIGGLKAFDASSRPFTEIDKYLANGTSPAT